MSELKVNKISPATGTAFTLGDSGDTFTIPSGATVTNNGTATGFVTAGALDLNGAVLTLDADGSINLDSQTKTIYFQAGGTTFGQVYGNSIGNYSAIKLYENHKPMIERYDYDYWFNNGMNNYAIRENEIMSPNNKSMTQMIKFTNVSPDDSNIYKDFINNYKL